MASRSNRQSTLMLALLLLVLPARADRVCVSSDSGTPTVCHDKLTPGTIVALVTTLLLLLLLLGGIAALLLRRRRYAAAKAAVAAKAYVIDAAQMRTTYAAAYDPHSAPPGVAGLPTKPGSAKGAGAPQTAPTTYGGVTYPFPGSATYSPKVAPRARSPRSPAHTQRCPLWGRRPYEGVLDGFRTLLCCNLGMVMVTNFRGLDRRRWRQSGAFGLGWFYLEMNELKDWDPQVADASAFTTRQTASAYAPNPRSTRGLASKT
ncbi:hypothetical protein DFH09DRAFT_259617 [Mycena vulgaris]|nr:hypothetical protein DFH09DRAFT_259617 [Mycena vulgaris]